MSDEIAPYLINDDIDFADFKEGLLKSKSDRVVKMYIDNLSILLVERRLDYLIPTLAEMADALYAAFKSSDKEETGQHLLTAFRAYKTIKLERILYNV
jgi:hypothetical protein